MLPQTYVHFFWHTQRTCEIRLADVPEKLSGHAVKFTCEEAVSEAGAIEILLSNLPRCVLSWETLRKLASIMDDDAFATFRERYHFESFSIKRMIESTPMVIAHQDRFVHLMNEMITLYRAVPHQ